MSAYRSASGPPAPPGRDRRFAEKDATRDSAPAVPEDSVPEDSVPEDSATRSAQAYAHRCTPGPDPGAHVGQVLSERYKLLRCLGSGAMGAVYEAREVGLDVSGEVETVALKRLHSSGPAALRRLKAEFRQLRDLVHPNVVRLYEMVVDGDLAFFTMERVVGVEFVDYVRASGRGSDGGERLRDAFIQLLQGATALHANGRLHLDLKPSNVLVETSGRVVLIDFGLVRRFLGRAHGAEVRYDPSNVGFGTPAYASPEQLCGAICGPSSRPPQLGPAADAYAIGTLLFECLHGKRPFVGSRQQILAQKSMTRTLLLGPNLNDAERVDPELDALCRQLLSRQPGERPALPTVLSRFEQQNGRRQRGASDAYLDLRRSADASAFVGRTAELAVLDGACGRARAGQQQWVRICGATGIGKSALVREFASRLPAQGVVLVLQGGCHLHEEVAYNAFDAAIDALADALAQLPPVEAAALLPRDTGLLARVFPVLLRVPGVATFPSAEPTTSADAKTRRRVFGALRELLGALADRMPTVLFLDDTQWGDDDSAALLRELVRGPDAPPLLLLTADRGDLELADCGALLESITSQSDTKFKTLTLGPLRQEDLGKLVACIGELPAQAGYLQTLFRESGGHPLLATELVRHAATHPALAGFTHDNRLEHMLAARVAALSDEGRRTLEMICLAGRRLSVDMLARLFPGTGDRASRELQDAGLVVTVGAGEQRHLTAYHSTITRAMRIPQHVEKKCYARLAQAGEDSGQVRAEQVLWYWQQAGEHLRARGLARSAAAEAVRSLAYARAIKLYRLALETTVDCEAADAAQLRIKLAEACALDGRPVEAARAYERAAADQVDHDAAFDLRCSAITQYMLSGDPRGTALLGSLGRALGISAPAYSTVPATLLNLLRIQWSRPRATAGPATERRAARLAEAAVLAAPFAGLRGQMLALRYLLALSVRIGGGTTAHQALLTTNVIRGLWMWTLGRPSQRGLAAIQASHRTAQQTGDVDLSLWLGCYQGSLRLYVSDFGGAVAYAQKVEQDGRPRGELGQMAKRTARMTLTVGYYLTGRLENWAGTAPGWIDAAVVQGDQELERHLRATTALRHLLTDDVSAARAEYAASTHDNDADCSPVSKDAWWPAWLELYAGDPVAACAVVAEAKARVGWVGRIDPRLNGVLLYWADALAAASRYQADNEPGALRMLRTASLRLRLYRTPLAHAASVQTRATLAVLLGRRAKGQRLLAQAIAAFDALGMVVQAASLRSRVDRLDGAAGLNEESEAGLRTLQNAGVRNVDHWVRMQAPGL